MRHCHVLRWTLLGICLGIGLLIAAASTADAATLTLTFTDNSDNETGFPAERCQGVACAPTVQAFVIPAHAGTGSTVHVDTLLPENTDFCYRVRATNTAGNSGYSNTACGKTAVSVPNAPTSLGITAILERRQRAVSQEAS